MSANESEPNANYVYSSKNAYTILLLPLLTGKGRPFDKLTTKLLNIEQVQLNLCRVIRVGEDEYLYCCIRV